MFHNKNSEKGISLFLALIVMATILSIVFGMTSILVSEIKVTRTIGYSTLAFCASDSGIEKTYYFDRKKIQEIEIIEIIDGEEIITTEQGTRGLCDICNSCSSSDCQDCTTSKPKYSSLAEDCEPMSCTNCEISFFTEFNGKRYRIEATVVPTGETTIKSFGFYKGIKRAIELTYISEGEGDGGPDEGPIITNADVVPRSVPEGIALDITADISDPDGVDADTTIAHIQSPDENEIDTIFLILFSGNEYRNTWTGPVGVYYVDITACDVNGNCSEAENI